MEKLTKNYVLNAFNTHAFYGSFWNAGLKHGERIQLESADVKIQAKKAFIYFQHGREQGLGYNGWVCRLTTADGKVWGIVTIPHDLSGSSVDPNLDYDLI